MYLPFVNQWLDGVKGDRFAVSEAWTGDVTRLSDYATLTGGRTRLFDVPLHYVFRSMSLGNGAWDMRGLKSAGFTEGHAALAVTFVDNHDTVNVGALHSPITNLKTLAYAYILTRGSAPCVFYQDYYGDHGDDLRGLIAVRKAHGYGAGREYAESDAEVYVYARAGDAAHPGLLLLLDAGVDAQRTVASPFPSASLIDASGHSSAVVKTDATGKGTFPVPARSYSVWVPQGS